ncbi:MAG: ABC transporter permease [Paracoccaceae bacterium]|nr:ABC transporter permease [Paracoccaceae bacterium]MDE2911732.1 ABC transporter permease [Paracoccaceae bacterium]
MFVVLLISFVVGRLSGTPFEIMFPDGLTVDHQIALEKKFKLDLPMHEQFKLYVTQIFKGDFGRSLHTGEKVWAMYALRMPATLAVGSLALLVAIIIGLPLGALSALYRKNVGVTGALLLVFLGYAVPHFVIGIGLILLFGYVLQILPTTSLDTWRHFVLPTITLAIPMIAVLARFMRAAMLDAIGQDYVSTATSKGLTDADIAKNHIFRNALVPIISVVGLEIAGLLNGTIFVETVFSLPGVGRILIGAVEQRDYPVLQFGLIAYSLIVVTVNLIVDLLYVVADPRIRLGK